MDGMLRISEAANIAIHAMVYLLRGEVKETISVLEIAQALGVSKDHLGKVLQRLSKVGLLTSRRGPKGGFSLGQDTARVTLLQILEAIDGPLAENTCLLGHPLCGGKQCILGDLMASLHRQVHDYLSSTTLSDIGEFSPLARKKAPRGRQRSAKQL